MADTKKPLNDENATGTDLEVLKKIEAAWKRNNPSSNRRNTANSLNWFRQYVGRSFNKARTSQMFLDKNMWKTNFTLGKMYFYEYDAKHKAKLPVWDRFPLMFPFHAYKAKDGATIVLGLNFHYLQPALRMAAFKALLKFKTDKRYRRSTRLNFDWQVIAAMAESPLFKQAIHAYREDHIKSVLVEVPAQAWELALFLPTARWVGDVSLIKGKK